MLTRFYEETDELLKEYNNSSNVDEVDRKNFVRRLSCEVRVALDNHFYIQKLKSEANKKRK